ncbi:hypothetical protein ACFE04_000260 [Oxalis oulophora]
MTTFTRATSALRVTAPAPPPSPIPTGAGSRSAANENLSRFLEKSLHVPDLALPLDSSPRHPDHHSPSSHYDFLAEIDLTDLQSKNPDSVDRILRSAAEYGAFRIGGCGFFGEELGSSLAKEAEPVFRILKRREFGMVSEGFSDREEIVWVHSDKVKNEMEWARKCIGDLRYRTFSEIMDDVLCKLGAIAEHISHIFTEDIGKQFEKKVNGTESVLSLHRYSRVKFQEPLMEQENYKCNAYTLSLHLPVQYCAFCVHSREGPVPFHANPDTIIVTIGKQLEEWSHRKYKSVTGEVISTISSESSQATFSIEFKYSSSDSNNNAFSKALRTITLSDQLFIALLFCLLYNFLTFFFD